MACESKLPVVLLCGLEQERRIVSRRYHTVISHGQCNVAKTALESAITRYQPKLLMSFGIAGGLVGKARNGSLLVPQHVVDDHGTIFACDPLMRRVLLDHMRHVPCAGDILGVDAPMLTAEAKLLAHAQSKAVAVDMESHVVAMAARDHDLPFVVLRAVADTSTDDLPDFLPSLIEPKGRMSRVCAVVWQRPQRLGVLIQLGRRTLRALITLRRAMAGLDGFSMAVRRLG